MPRHRRNLTTTLLSLTLSAGIALSGTACGVLGGSPGGPPDALEFWMYQPANASARQLFEKLRGEFEKANNATLKLVRSPRTTTTPSSPPRCPAAPARTPATSTSRWSPGTPVTAPSRSWPPAVVDERAYFAGALNTNRVNGKLYGLPLDHTAVALFYNKKLVAARRPGPGTSSRPPAPPIHRADPEIAGMVVPKGDGYGGWMWPAFLGRRGRHPPRREGQADEPVRRQPAVDALQLWVDLLASSPRQDHRLGQGVREWPAPP